MNTKLKTPANAIVAALAVIGGIMMLSFLVCSGPDRIPVVGFILWTVGIAVLAIYTGRKKGQSG